MVVEGVKHAPRVVSSPFSLGVSAASSPSVWAVNYSCVRLPPFRSQTFCGSPRRRNEWVFQASWDAYETPRLTKGSFASPSLLPDRSRTEYEYQAVHFVKPVLVERILRAVHRVTVVDVQRIFLANGDLKNDSLASVHCLLVGLFSQRRGRKKPWRPWRNISCPDRQGLASSRSSNLWVPWPSASTGRWREKQQGQPHVHAFRPFSVLFLRAIVADMFPSSGALGSGWYSSPGH